MGGTKWIQTNGIKHTVLIGQSFCYLAAYSSIFWQYKGLYGERGILPVARYFDNEECNADLTLDGLGDNFARCRSPLLFLVHRRLGVLPSTSFAMVALFGIILSILTIMFRFCRNALSYLTLVFMYWSLFQVGGTFMWFQWDTLLLESGYLMVVLSAFWDSPADTISLFLIRFLAARLMFASGVVKLQSGCNTWWGLTALHHHFESQCLPTQAAWYAHHVNDWFKRLSVAGTFLIEVYLPPLFLLPMPTLRYLAAIPQLFLMILIAVTGNYNFFNLHYAVLVLACFEVGHGSREKKRTWTACFEILASCLIFLLIVHHWMTLFTVQLNLDTFQVSSKIAFTEAQFNEYVKFLTSFIVHLGIIFSLVAVVQAIIQNLFIKDYSARRGAWKHTFFVTFIGAILFWTSIVPFSTVDKAANARVPEAVRKLHKITEKFQVASSYGLFRQMTGVEGRPEIILEGSTEPNGPWTEIEFYTKPHNLSAAPKFVAPHQPRLDWQMWFAALGAYQHNPFFLSTVNQLLNNNTDVFRLMKKNPFTKEEPMNFLRAQLYIYRYTKPGQTDWWTRSLQHEYMPTMTKDSPPLVEFLKRNGLIGERLKYKASPIDKSLQRFHSGIVKYDQTHFVFAMFYTVFGMTLLPIGRK